MGAAAAGAALAPSLLEACQGARAVPTTAPSSVAPTESSPPGRLRAVGGRIVDPAGKSIELTGVNWFGLETSNFAPHGLWSRGWGEMLDQIVDAGFNTLRLPFSNQLLEPASLPNSIDYAKNPELRGLTGLQLMDVIVEGAGARGLAVVLDRHRPTTDGQSELWYTDRVPESRWIDDWVMLARHYRQQTAVIGADLHNEPHGPASWGDGNPKTDWRLAAERAGNAILAANPDWLILVEGVEKVGSDSYWWGGNLVGARQNPIRLSRTDRLVYSAHDYGPGVYQQAWFRAADFPRNLPAVWKDHWAYLEEQRTAPVLIGEFGGRSVGSDPEGTWQRALVEFMKSERISYTYWAWNPNSGDTGGLLKDDWQTVDRAKLDLLKSYQAPRLAKPASPGARRS